MTSPYLLRRLRTEAEARADIARKPPYCLRCGVTLSDFEPDSCRDRSCPYLQGSHRV